MNTKHSGLSAQWPRRGLAAAAIALGTVACLAAVGAETYHRRSGTRADVLTFPDYGSTAEVKTWQYGPDMTGAATSWGSTTGNTNKTTSSVAYQLWPLRLTAGTYTFNNVVCNIDKSGTSATDAVYFIIYTAAVGANPVSALLTRHTSTAIQTGLSITSDTIYSHAFSSTVTINPSLYDYYVGVGLHQVAGTASYQIIKRLNGDGSADAMPGQYVFIRDADSPEATIQTQTTYTYMAQAQLTFTSTNSIVSVPPHALNYGRLVPWSTSTGYWIMLKDLHVTDGNAGIIKVKYNNAGVGATAETITQDFGATDQITVTDIASTTVSHPHNAVTTEAHNTFDLGLRVMDTYFDVFWQNTEVGQGPQGALDIATYSHAAKRADYVAGGERGLGASDIYPGKAPQWLCFPQAGNAFSATSVSVVYMPLVVLGDSQCSYLRPALESAFSVPRWAWGAYVSGSCLAKDSTGNHTAGYKRVMTDAPGAAAFDLAEMHDVVWVIAGYGINDVSNVTTTETDWRGEMAQYQSAAVTALRWMFYQHDANDRLLVLGLPPDNGQLAAEWKRTDKLIRRVNMFWEGVTRSLGGIYYDPYDLVDGNIAAYLQTANVHYSTAGATAAARAAAAKYEAARTW